MKKKCAGGLLILAALLWVGVIWGQSMVPATLSSKESGWVLVVAERVLALFHIPNSVTEHLVRKAAHFTEYLVMGVLISLNLRKLGGRERLSFALFIGLFVPMVDETI